MPRVDRAKRLVRLVSVLSRQQTGTGKDNGISLAQIQKLTGSSRATVFRDLAILKDSGCTVSSTTVNGEARYKAAASELRATAMTAKEQAALALARRALTSVEGTWLARELDSLLARAGANVAQESGVAFARVVMSFDPAVLAVLHDSVTLQRKVRIRYRGANDTSAAARTVHGIRIVVVDQTPYFVAWDETKRAVRTFKVARLSRPQLLRSKCEVPASALAGPSPGRSVKVWDGEAVDVRIRIAAPLVRYLAEWPLIPEQSIESAPDGGVDVCARVNGLTETTRWVLRIGSGARVIAPPALVKRVTDELEAALAGYRAPVSVPYPSHHR